MSDLYSIQSSTLTDIGDALRRRHGDTKIITVEEYDTKFISSTPHTTGFNSFDESYKLPAGDYYDVVHIPGATKIVVNVAYHTYKSLYGQFHMAAGEYSTSNPIPTSPEYTGSSGGVKIFEFEGDTITFHFCWRLDLAGYLGYYAECEGYDADGNVLYNFDRVIDVEKEVFNGYSSAEMAEAIDAIKVGVFPPDDVLHLTGDCGEKFKNGIFDWLIEQCGSQMTTYDLTDTENMFNNSKLERIPFALNYKNAQNNVTSQTFTQAAWLRELPAVNGRVANMYNFLNGCFSVREIPESWATTIKFSHLNSGTSWYLCRLQGFFGSCYSLRTIPEAFLKQLWNKCSAANAWGQMFYCCYVLDEIVGLRLANAAATSNMFINGFFTSCYRLKRLVFDMENGSPRTENWQNQTIDLSENVGYSTSGNKVMITDFNSGITADKEVVDDATYNALKNDPDWYTANVAYSRYNHDSAVETINSLPDCSSSGGTNTIKFTGAAGSATDGGAINTLTEEEIAVATVKGWTVSFV